MVVIVVIVVVPDVVEERGWVRFQANSTTPSLYLVHIHAQDIQPLVHLTVAVVVVPDIWA